MYVLFLCNFDCPFHSLIFLIEEVMILAYSSASYCLTSFKFQFREIDGIWYINFYCFPLNCAIAEKFFRSDQEVLLTRQAGWTCCALYSINLKQWFRKYKCN